MRNKVIVINALEKRVSHLEDIIKITVRAIAHRGPSPENEGLNSKQRVNLLDYKYELGKLKESIIDIKRLVR